MNNDLWQNQGWLFKFDSDNTSWLLKQLTLILIYYYNINITTYYIAIIPFNILRYLQIN